MDKHISSRSVITTVSTGDIGTHLVDTVFCVVVPHRGLEYPKGSVAVTSRHPAPRLAKDIAQQLD